MGIVVIAAVVGLLIGGCVALLDTGAGSAPDPAATADPGLEQVTLAATVASPRPGYLTVSWEDDSRVLRGKREAVRTALTFLFAGGPAADGDDIRAWRLVGRIRRQVGAGVPFSRRGPLRRHLKLSPLKNLA